MNRDLLYPGQLGLVDNILDAFKYAMINDGLLAEAVLGQTTQVVSLAAAPLANTAVSGYAFAISIGRGAIFSYQQTDENAYGVLGTDASNIIKVGINLAPTNLGVCNAAPATPGYSVNYLIAAAFQENDANSVNMPFYNASGAPTVSVQNGTRAQTVVFSVTGGPAAPTGTQQTPTSPAGYVPLWVVTVTNGQSAVLGNDIVAAPDAPFTANIPSLSSEIATLASTLSSETAARQSQSGNLKGVVQIYSTTALTQGQQGSLIELYPGVTVTTTLPSPVGQGGAFFRVYNGSNFGQTIKTSAGLLVGPGGSNGISVSLAPTQMVDATSDGSNWILSSIGSPKPRYLATQSGIINIANSTTYQITTATLTFPNVSRTGSFRIMGRLVAGGLNISSGGSTARNNFQSSVSDSSGTIFEGAQWLVTSGYAQDNWGISDTFLSNKVYGPGVVETFTYSVTTYGGGPDFSIENSFMELYAIEA